MKRFQSGAEERKKLKRIKKIIDKLIIKNKPKNIGNIVSLKYGYKDKEKTFNRGLSYDHFYRIKKELKKKEVGFFFQKQ